MRRRGRRHREFSAALQSSGNTGGVVSAVPSTAVFPPLHAAGSIKHAATDLFCETWGPPDRPPEAHALCVALRRQDRWPGGDDVAAAADVLAPVRRYRLQSVADLRPV